jgi:hypothetical protein
MYKSSKFFPIFLVKSPVKKGFLKKSFVIEKKQQNNFSNKNAKSLLLKVYQHWVSFWDFWLKLTSQNYEKHSTISPYLLEWEA